MQITQLDSLSCPQPFPVTSSSPIHLQAYTPLLWLLETIGTSTSSSPRLKLQFDRYVDRPLTTDEPHFVSAPFTTSRHPRSAPVLMESLPVELIDHILDYVRESHSKHISRAAR